MVTGLWLEPEVAGAKSLLAQKPDDWFFMRHGQTCVEEFTVPAGFPPIRRYGLTWIR